MCDLRITFLDKLSSLVAFRYHSFVIKPVKLSDSLALEARLIGETTERSIAGHVEFWTRLGRSVELTLQGQQVLRLCQNAVETGSLPTGTVS